MSLEAGMSLTIRMILAASLLPAMAGCADMHQPLDDMQADMDKARLEKEPQKIRPGLESLYQKPAQAEPAPQRRAPVAPPPETLPFPAGTLPLAQAEILLAGDPMAMRFLAVKGLAEQGLIPVEDAAQRRDANLGALLPMTAPQPPAAGLEKSVPPASRIIDEVAGLAAGQGRGNDASRAAEQDFLIDTLLPKTPTARRAWPPQDVDSARKQQERLGRLQDAGLITPEQRAAETAALDTLIAGGGLPQQLVPPTPMAAAEPAPAKPKAAPSKSAGRAGARMPGGVSGKLVVLPSPPQVNAPALAADSKEQGGLHLLSMASAAHGDKAWEALKKEHPDLAKLGYTVARTDLGELGVTYRLIAGPLPAAEAHSMCATLKGQGQSCTPTVFPPQ